MKLKAAITDFLISLTLLSILCIGVMFVKTVLYGGGQTQNPCTITTKPLPIEYYRVQAVGGEVYDAVSKRSLGKVTRVTPCFLTDSFTLTIFLERAVPPRSAAIVYGGVYMRCEEVVWEATNYEE